MLVSSRSETFVLILKFSILKNKDFLFEPDTHIKFIMFVHLMNSFMINILIKNEFEVSIQILKKFDINLVIEVNYENCF